jgi:hypothetical protein
MRNFLAAALCLFGLGGPVHACWGPGGEDHHYPSCVIPLPQPDETVSLLYGDWPHGDGSAELSDHHLGDDKSRTRVVRFHIDENDARNYLILSAQDQTIWEFTGDIDSISRVVVLGATRIGPNGGGVIGIPAERISFTTPDLSLLDRVDQTSCTRIYRSCITEQWFGNQADDRISFHPPSPQPRQRFDAIVPSQTRGIDGPQPSITKIPPDSPDALVEIDPARVVSPNTPQPYALLPGVPGMASLVASGAVIPVGDDHANALVKEYGETFSARYRSRFDPDFLFVPSVDFIVTRKITLPPELPPVTLLVANGVPAPEMNGNDNYYVCLFFADQSREQLQAWDHESYLCRQTPGVGGTADDPQDILRAALDFDTSNVENDDCRIAPLPDEVHVAAIALSEGEGRRYRNDPMRQIDVVVNRGGPTALFLSMEGGPVQWNLTGSEVVAVYADREDDPEMTQVMLNGNPYDLLRLGNPNEGCPWFAPLFPNRLGPAIAHLDEMFDALTGHRIDQLITFTDTGQPWRDADLPAPTYVVE